MSIDGHYAKNNHPSDKVNKYLFALVISADMLMNHDRRKCRWTFDDVHHISLRSVIFYIKREKTRDIVVCGPLFRNIHVDITCSLILWPSLNLISYQKVQINGWRLYYTLPKIQPNLFPILGVLYPQNLAQS